DRPVEAAQLEPRRLPQRRAALDDDRPVVANLRLEQLERLVGPGRRVERGEEREREIPVQLDPPPRLRQRQPIGPVLEEGGHGCLLSRGTTGAERRRSCLLSSRQRSSN